MVEQMSILDLALVALAGVLASIINVLAGGGGMLVLPLLMALGMPADFANGTYRLSVLTQSAAGGAAFYRGGHLPIEAAWRILAPTVVGAAIGAYGATVTPREALKPIILVTMIAMAALIAINRRTLIPSAGSALALRERPHGYVLLLAIGVYAGFIQAGVGFLLLGVLVGLLRHDLVAANALKLVCTLAFGSIALAIFVWAGLVSWLPAIVLAVASILGALIGVRIAVRISPDALRWFVFVCVVATSLAAWFRS